MSRIARVGTLALYVAAFWVALPAGLWRVADAIDSAQGWTREPHPVGFVLLLAGAVLVAAAMLTLRREGRGLPVSALPPPRLAQGGPYGYVRHPIYLGFNLALLGAGLAAGSTALAWIVAPLFLPLWIAYALVEERWLVRRYADRYRHYRRCVGLLPAIPGLELTRLLGHAFPLTLLDAERIPREGPAILVANHCCYLDPVFVGCATLRRVHFLATAEMFRHPVGRAYSAQRGLVPVRRYRSDVAACREMLRLLADGRLVGLFVEGERSLHGDYQGADPAVARILRRLPYPVIPVGLSGSYDCGPRWSGLLRRRPVTVRVGPALDWGAGDAAATLDLALRALIGHGPQPLHLDGLPLQHIGRALWRCPWCLDEPGWSPPTLACSACGACLSQTHDGMFLAPSGRSLSFADMVRRITAVQEVGPLRLAVECRREAQPGPIRLLQRLGAGILEISPAELRFDALAIPTAELRSVSIERSDTLQVATRDGMWQFRSETGSVFRLRAALEGWRTGSVCTSVVAREWAGQEASVAIGL